MSTEKACIFQNVEKMRHCVNLLSNCMLALPLWVSILVCEYLYCCCVLSICISVVCSYQEKINIKYSSKIIEKNADVFNMHKTQNQIPIRTKHTINQSKCYFQTWKKQKSLRKNQVQG